MRLIPLLSGLEAALARLLRLSLLRQTSKQRRAASAKSGDLLDLFFISTLLSVTAYYCAYEVWHAVLHLPFERFWRPAMASRVLGHMVRRMYGFHLMHHWRPGAFATHTISVS